MLMSCPECSSTLFLKSLTGKPVLHKCSGHGGMILPMVPAGTKAKVTLVEREDYIKGESPRVHNGRPIMAAVVTREDGEDRVVFAPTATGGGGNGLV